MSLRGAARHRGRGGPGGPPSAALLVGFATVLLYAVLVVWACVTPAFRAPDEPQQISTTLRLAYEHSYPAPGDARIYPPVKASYRDVGFGGIGLNTIIGMGPLREPAPGQLSGQTMRELGAAETAPVTPYDYDQMTQHPPGYFAVMAVAARVFDVIDMTPHAAIFVLRLCSALLLLPLPFLTFRIARALGASSGGAAAAAFLPAALPQLTHVAGAVSNDTLTVTLGAAVTWLSIEVARRRRARRWALALGLTTSGLLLTKGIALPMLVVVLVAFLLRAKRFGSRRTVGDAVLALACMLPGLSWWVANVVRFGTLQPDGYPKSYVDLLPTGHIGFGTWLHGFFPAMARSFFADFGWLEAPPPSALTGALSIVVLALVAIGVLRSRDRLGETLLAQLSWIMPLIAIMDTSHAASARTGALQGVQGRYLFVGVAAVAATIVLALRADREAAVGAGAGRGLRSWPYVALPLIAAVIAGLGLVAGISHFYTGDGLLGKIGTFTSWSPLRLRYLAPIAAIGTLAAIAGAVAISRGDSSNKSRSAISSLRPGETVIR